MGIGGVCVCLFAFGCGPGGDDDAVDSGNAAIDGGGGGTIDAPPALDAPSTPDARPSYDGAPSDAAVVAYDADVTTDAPFADASFDDGGIGADASWLDGGVIAMCNPIAQTGCQPGEKCSQLVESDAPFLAVTTCVPDGNVPNGGMCTEGTPGPNTGYDDCVAGNLCTGGECLEICGQLPDSCPAGESCVPFANTFDDLDNVGLCNPECDVLAQDCTQDPNDTFGTGCYISLQTGNATCAPALPEMVNGMPGTQQDACMYLNTCAVGYGCTLLDDPVPSNNVCAKFCDPMNSGGPICDDTGSATTCAQINMFYNDADQVPDEVGFCVDCTVWTDVPPCMP